MSVEAILNMRSGTLTKLDKSKIIDLWKHKRQQIKNRKKRTLYKKILLIIGLSLINTGIWLLLLKSSNPPIEGSVQIYGATKLNAKEITPIILGSLPSEEYWLLKLPKEEIRRKIQRNYPLISNIDFKPVIDPFYGGLRIYVQEDIPWARFSNGWLLTSSGRIIQSTQRMNFNKMGFVSDVLIFAKNCDFAYWQGKSEELQKLIFSLTTQFPENPLRGIKLNDKHNISAFYNKVQVSLGSFDETIQERAGRLSSAKPVLKKYFNHENLILDLKDGSRAILKFEEPKK
jgi:hypothetical protein